MDQAALDKAAKLLQRLDGVFEEGGEFASFKDRLKALEGLSSSVDGLAWVNETLKGFDPTEFKERYEELREGQISLRRQIRQNRGGLYISGIEDAAEDFSFLKAIIASYTRNWKNAGFEKEVIDQVREKHFSKAAHVAGDDESARNFIPDQVIPDIIEAIYTKSTMIDLAGDGRTLMSVLDGLTGGNVRVPRFDGGTIAYWIGEEDDYAESQVSTGDMTLEPNKLGVLVRITDTMQRLQGYGFDRLLRNDMVRAAAKKIDWTALLGTGGDHMPLGAFYHPSIPVWSASDGEGYANQAALIAATTNVNGAELDFDGFDNMQLYLEEDDVDVEPFSVSCPRYYRRLRQQKVEHWDGQTSQMAYLLGAPMIPSSRLKELIGDYGTTTQIPSNANAGLGILPKADTTNDGKCTGLLTGDLSEMLFGRWAGIEIVDDGGRGTGFISDHTYIKLRMYADIGYRQTRRLMTCLDAVVRD